jgi:preprotein translocase subunit SecG
MGVFFAIVLSILAVFLILLVLVQRGRGGGLAGALGGMGGSSAFGAKAGDVFTRITVITAAVWIVLSLVAVFWANHRGDVFGTVQPASPSDRALDMLPQARPDAKTGETGVGVPAEKSDAAPATTAPESSPPPAAASETAPPADGATKE